MYIYIHIYIYILHILLHYTTFNWRNFWFQITLHRFKVDLQFAPVLLYSENKNVCYVYVQQIILIIICSNLCSQKFEHENEIETISNKNTLCGIDKKSLETIYGHAHISNLDFSTETQKFPNTSLFNCESNRDLSVSRHIFNKYTFENFSIFLYWQLRH